MITFLSKMLFFEPQQTWNFYKIRRKKPVDLNKAKNLNVLHTQSIKFVNILYFIQTNQTHWIQWKKYKQRNAFE